MTVDALTFPREKRHAGGRSRRESLARLLPTLVGAAVVLGAGFLAWQVARQDRRQVEAEVAVAAAGVQADLTSEVQGHVQGFRRMARRWEVWRAPEGAAWQADMALFFDHFPALSGLAWVGADGSLLWQSARSDAALSGGLGGLVERGMSSALSQVRRQGRPLFAPPVGPAGSQRLVPLYVPLAGDGGALLALLDSRKLLGSILADQLVFGYGVDVALYGVPVYGAGAPEASGTGTGRWLVSDRVEMYGAPWMVRVWPSATLLDAKRSWLPAAVLVAGLLLATALAVSGQLARRERLQAAELERARRELERSNGELEQFAYVASHDLQEPLRQVAGFLGLLERRYGQQLDGDAHEFIAFAVDGAHRMQQLINDLLAYSRVGTRGGTPEPTRPAEALGRAVADLGKPIEESGALITQDGLFFEVLVDPRQLALVFQNLLSNAIKYAGEGRPRIHVSAQRKAAEVEICVADHGIGIDPKFFDRIFIIFQRLHTREQFPGTGIGLAIVRRAIEQHGGRIWVESSPGEGTAFHFTLPAAEIEASP